MSSVILFGLRGLRHIDVRELSPVDSSGILGDGSGEMFLTTAGRASLRAGGSSMFDPTWENRLNDLVTEYVSRGFASESIAQDLFIELGNEESRAGASMSIELMTRQRVREAVLGFNLLATGSRWEPRIKSGFPYRSRDWVEWCDQYIAEMRRGATEFRPVDMRAARYCELAGDDLHTIRGAFAASDFSRTAPVPSANSGGGCYVATAVYGSYDGPNVRILRRWRDQRLATSPRGRAFIRAYYAASPRLLHAVGDRAWFTPLVRLPLDSFVRRLRHRGYGDGPYSDAPLSEG